MTELRRFNTEPLPLRLRIEDFLLLDAADAFADYAKIELIDGEIIYMNAQHRPHAIVKMELYDALRARLLDLGSPLRPLTEASLALPPTSMPEPDVVLTSEPRGAGAVPLASVALVIEVADASLPFDLGRKQTLYARSGIAEYWVADVEGRVMHLFASPSDDRYADHRIVPFGSTVAAASIAGLMIATATL